METKRICETCQHAFKSEVCTDKPIFCIEHERFEEKDDSCKRWQEKHKAKN